MAVTTSVQGPLRKFNIIDGHDPSTVIAEIKLAVLTVTVQRVTQDGVVSGAPLQDDAIIDTGATTSSVYPDLREALELEQSDYSELGSGGLPGEEERKLYPLYWMRVTIGEQEWDVPVVERRVPDDKRAVIIGCDVLQHYRFTYDGLDGPDGSFTLYLPD